MVTLLAAQTETRDYEHGSYDAGLFEGLSGGMSETGTVCHPGHERNTVYLLGSITEIIQTSRRQIQKFGWKVRVNSVAASVRGSNVGIGTRPGRNRKVTPTSKPLGEGYFVLEAPENSNRQAILYGPIPASNESEALDVHLSSQGRTAAELGLALTPISTGPQISSATSRFNKMSYQVCHSNSMLLDQLLLRQHQCNMRFQKATCYTYRPEPLPPPPPSPRSSNFDDYDDDYDDDESDSGGFYWKSSRPPVMRASAGTGGNIFGL